MIFMEDTEFQMVTEIQPEVKILKFLNIKNLGFTAVGAVLGYVLSGAVYSDLALPFVIFNALVGFVLSLPSPFNKGKCVYQSVMFFIKGFKKKKITYKSIDVEPYEDDVIEENIFMYGNEKELM